MGTTAIGFTRSVGALIGLRAGAWFGRGFRSPLRDFLLSDEVGPTHFGRAYGLERSADMLGAVAGPLLAVVLLWAGWDFRRVILWSVVPSAISVVAIYLLTRDRRSPAAPVAKSEKGLPQLPRVYWLFVTGVLLFGLGDFSRTFLIYLVANTMSPGHLPTAGLSIAVLLYAFHNGVSAIAAYPAGRIGDRRPKLAVLILGYGLGVATNCLLALFTRSLPVLVVVIVLSGIYIAIEETIEKAVAAEILAREQRSLGLGILACANAVGDMGSSIYVGTMLATHHDRLAFIGPALVGLLGVSWMVAISARFRATIAR